MRAKTLNNTTELLLKTNTSNPCSCGQCGGVPNARISEDRWQNGCQTSEVISSSSALKYCASVDPIDLDLSLKDFPSGTRLSELLFLEDGRPQTLPAGTERSQYPTSEQPKDADEDDDDDDDDGKTSSV